MRVMYICIYDRGYKVRAIENGIRRSSGGREWREEEGMEDDKEKCDDGGAEEGRYGGGTYGGGFGAAISAASGVPHNGWTPRPALSS